MGTSDNRGWRLICRDGRGHNHYLFPMCSKVSRLKLRWFLPTSLTGLSTNDCNAQPWKIRSAG